MGFRFSGLSWFYAESEDLIGLKLVGRAATCSRRPGKSWRSEEFVEIYGTYGLGLGTSINLAK